MKDTAILWFRNDLRLHDNEALTLALSRSDYVIPVYIFDPRVYQANTVYGFRKTGKHRCKFLIECVRDLRENLKKRGSNLLVRVGFPEDEIAKIAEEFRTSWVFCNRERTDEEVKVQDALEKKLWALGQELVYARGKMLFYTSDLPFPISHTPDTFSSFRKEVENFVPIRQPLPTPESIPLPVENINWGNIPTLEDFDFTTEDFSFQKTRFVGGETSALKQLNYYLWETDNIARYKESRNDLLGWDFSSKLSAWLAAGAISPKMIYHEVKRYEKERRSNESTYWLIFELLWRDFFRLMGKKYGNKIFKLSGTADGYAPDNIDLVLFEKWASGNTGVPFIDANMKELNATGYMSNRGRQNVASFLVKDMKLNWLLGAMYFESMLIDYDPCSNYGNWNYVAGVGSDPRENRYFNILSQAKRYDPQAEFIKHWIPVLNNLPLEHVFAPYELSLAEQQKYNFFLGRDYPDICIPVPRWKTSS